MGILGWMLRAQDCGFRYIGFGNKGNLIRRGYPASGRLEPSKNTLYSPCRPPLSFAATTPPPMAAAQSSLTIPREIPASPACSRLSEYAAASIVLFCSRHPFPLPRRHSRSSGCSLVRKIQFCAPQSLRT